MIPLPPGSTRTDTRFPYTTLSRSARRRLPSRRDRARLALCPTPRPHATLASERRKPMQAVTEGDRRKELATLLTQIQTHPEREWTAARRRIAQLNKKIGSAAGRESVCQYVYITGVDGP